MILLDQAKNIFYKHYSFEHVKKEHIKLIDHLIKCYLIRDEAKRILALPNKEIRAAEILKVNPEYQENLKNEIRFWHNLIVKNHAFLNDKSDKVKISVLENFNPYYRELLRERLFK